MLDNMLEQTAGESPSPAAFVDAAGSADAPAVPQSKITGIAICGSNQTTIGAAPFGRNDWLIYACSPDNTPYGNNKNCRELPRVSEWFEVHLPIADETRPFGYLSYIAAKMPTVWLRDEQALATGFFKGGRLYPEKELRGTSKVEAIKVPAGTFKQVQDIATGSVGFAEINETRRTEIPNNDGLFVPYMFTSSIAYMLAMAIVRAQQEGISTIGLWGIMQQTDNEYAYQRPGIQYFLSEAQRRGIKVVANRNSCLFDMPNWKW
jgi:hypothetical protein